ncbi:cobyric acid synthase CobQ [Paenibacillus pectinilyticus]|uniref:Cobyric acid synthase n=1 Tax=Paenibacillus pectinilyticus TaxID=512399 RepID=A0A1C0ZRD1_9BACL|nr:cobyric acid synthase [Paenibacillus pectinilyticus]OCT10622.1 cobyric acid synthase CobQ [Paenibacillus pectinilyticus]
MSNRAEQASVLMIQGTASDVGKSILTAALCRIFTQDGWQTAPFKSQNMSLNSYITFDGKEIGRAQGVQADACRIAATTDMNPILLKPKQDMVAQVVVHGKPYADLDARTYRESYLPKAEVIVKDALARLRSQYDLVVLEGAGSPAEVNLKDRDIVNMRLAGWADSPVLLVADIDRGGVFASIVGTLEILTPEERDRVKGFIINKFRGDVSLLKPGLDWLEERTGKPVLGVIPYLQQLGIEDEDSASLDSKRAQRNRFTDDLMKRPDQLDIAVIRLPRLSNFTDFDPLQEESDVHFRYIDHLADWGEPDVILLPGSKNTMEDLHYLKESGLAARVTSFVQEEGGHVVGICAGYQMLGVTLSDPGRYESEHEALEGLGLLPTETMFTSDKRTVRVQGVSTLFAGERLEIAIDGYEIHMGRTHYKQDSMAPFRITAQSGTNSHHPLGSQQLHDDGAASSDGRVWGTYIHGILHNDDFRRAWLNRIRANKGLSPISEGLRYKERREAAFDRLAEHVRHYLDMSRIYEMMGVSKPTKMEGI